MENWDTGYIPSFSWRVINGQDIYQDFLYKGPPITIYFHAFWMKILPDFCQFYFIRVVNYILFSIQVYLTVCGFNAIYDFNKKGIDKWLLCCICFIISVHNFTPSPWPTTDGLLFASVAFYIFSKNKLSSLLTLLLVALFCLLSALTKQSFYLIPFGFLLWIFIKSGLNKALIYVAFLISLFGVYLLWISSFTSLSNYFELTSNQTRLIDLINSGIIGYVRCFHNKWILFTVILIPFIICFIQIKSFSLKLYLKYLTISALFSCIIYQLLGNLFEASMIFFNTCLIAIFYHCYSKGISLKFLSPILISLLIAWSASISVGYPYTILYSTGMICCFITVFYEEIPKFQKSNLCCTILLLGTLLAAFISNKTPYHENKIFNLIYSLEDVSPKLNYIKTDKDKYERLHEIKMLIHKYGKNYIVAPNTPMANYIFNTQSQLPADWLLNNEIMGRDDEFIKLASNKKNYIFIEKEFIDKHPFCSTERYPETDVLHSKIAYYIYDNFNRIDETKNFIIFNAQK